MYGGVGRNSLHLHINTESTRLESFHEMAKCQSCKHKDTKFHPSEYIIKKYSGHSSVYLQSLHQGGGNNQITD